MEQKRHLHEYVWMTPPGGGAPEQITTEGEEIGRRMFQGWSQCEPPAVQPKPQSVKE